MAREMKDSGVEWIGEIPEEWKLVQLKRFAFVNNGREIPEEVDKCSEAIPVYGSGGVFKYTTNLLYDGQVVMFGRKGTLGKPLYANCKFWTVDTMYFLTFSGELSGHIFFRDRFPGYDDGIYAGLRLIEILTNNEKLKVNEAVIKDTLLKSYLDVRYYNHCGDVNADYNGKNIFSRVTEELNNISVQLIKKYKGNDKLYEDKVNKYFNLFILTLYLEDYFISEDDTALKIDAYKKKINKYLYKEYRTNVGNLIKDTIKIQKVYAKIIKENLEKMNTNMFTLNYNTLTKKNIFALDLVHNINFSRIYSNYIVDKTYDEGIIAEDKILVTINLLSTTVIRNMIEKKFKYSYVLYIPSTLLKKGNKLNKLLKLLDDEMLKNSVVLLVDYKDSLTSKTILKTIKKQGYKLAITISDYMPVKVKDVATLKLATYIFIDKKINKELNVDKLLDKDSNTSIILEDILPKVGIEKGE